jgi:hypothetical protein
VEGALARIQLNQLASLPQDDGARLCWQLELPLRLGQELHDWGIRVERDATGGGRGEAAASWTVRLAFDLEPLGPVQVRVRLEAGGVSGTFRAERGETVGLIDGRLDLLRRRLEAVGLEVTGLSSLRGLVRPPTPSFRDVPLVDETA